MNSVCCPRIVIMAPQSKPEFSQMLRTEISWAGSSPPPKYNSGGACLGGGGEISPGVRGIT